MKRGPAGREIGAGRLDRRVTLERATESRDAFNNLVPSWATLATVWASKQDVSDGERIAAAQVGAEISTRFVIRWLQGVNPKDRLSCEGRLYDITAVKELGRREGLELSAVARAE